jgi:hypothetical protein
MMIAHICRDLTTERSDSEAERALGTGIIMPALEAAVRTTGGTGGYTESIYYHGGPEGGEGLLHCQRVNQ